MRRLSPSFIRCIQCSRLQLLKRSFRCYSTGSNKNNNDNFENRAKTLLDNAATYEDEVPKSPEDVWSTSPYPKGTESRRSQAKHSLRPMVNPQETTVIMFPGQGTQYVGMGKDMIKFPSALEIFKCASDILKLDLLKLCTEGPAEKLKLTKHQQLAVFVCSIAALEKLKEEQPSVIENCVATAGFSLGELSALVFSEVLSFEDAVRLVKVRAEAMHYSAEMYPGAMVTAYCGPDSKIGEACLAAQKHAEEKGLEIPYCGISNYMYPNAKIIGGNKEAIEFLEQNQAQFKIRKLIRLPVSGAFHTPLMQPAVKPFQTALNKLNLGEPSIAVHSNITGKIYKNSADVRKKLPKQIVAPVRWEQILHIIYERPGDVPFPRTYECGPGKSLSTILKMVNFKAWQSCYNIPV